MAVTQKKYWVRFSSSLIHHRDYLVSKMELHASENKDFVMLFSLSEDPLLRDISVDGIKLVASAGMNTTGHLEVPVTSANSSKNYYVIASYAIRNASIITNPIAWMHNGHSTTFSFTSFILGILGECEVIGTAGQSRTGSLELYLQSSIYQKYFPGTWRKCHRGQVP